MEQNTSRTFDVRYTGNTESLGQFMASEKSAGQPVALFCLTTRQQIMVGLATKMFFGDSLDAKACAAVNLEYGLTVSLVSK